ncbi:MAG: hypothetical protein ACRDY4_13340 [Acidimicrobiia bacterium]
MSESPSARAHVLVRVWLPDRPGALGAVASRIGAMRGDIIGLDVLERGKSVAVDEFAVELEQVELVPMLVREIEEVDGASVEEVRVVTSFPDPRIDALESAAALCQADGIDELQNALVCQLRDEFVADWVALLEQGCVLHADGVLPATEKLAAFAAGTVASPLVAEGATGPEDLAVATLPAHDAALLVGRDGHPFRRRERMQLLALARIAGRAWELLQR